MTHAIGQGRPIDTINAGPTYQVTAPVLRCGSVNVFDDELSEVEIMAFDAIHDSPALAALSTELGLDVRAAIRVNLIENQGDYFVKRMTPLMGTYGNVPNPLLVPNSHIVLGGSGASRTVTVTPVSDEGGTAVISLSVDDGDAVTTASFTLTVDQPGVTAIAGGFINDAATGGVAPPVAGATTRWRTGAQSIKQLSATETFHGQIFQIQTGGQFAPAIAAAVLTLNNVILSGGTIAMGNNLGLTMDLSGQVLTLNSGTLRAGGSNNGRDVRFRKGSLAGSGTIAITGLDTTGSDVEFQSTIQTSGFNGVFDVRQNGILKLPPIPVESASFGVVLSGTGRYTHDANVALKSLVIGGDFIPAGTYRYSDFTVQQRAFLVNASDSVSITVLPAPNHPPLVSELSDLSMAHGTSMPPIAFTVEDAETAADQLVLELTSDNSLLLPAQSLAIEGSGSVRTILIMPVAGILGSAMVTLSVSDGTATVTESFEVTVTGTPLETWRYESFGSLADSGKEDLSADPDGDGENNLLEFATGQHPERGTRAITTLVATDGGWVFDYTRSISAIAGNVIFEVQWNDTLSTDGWTSEGVVEQVISASCSVETVRATLPDGDTGKCFVRLRVVQP